MSTPRPRASAFRTPLAVLGGFALISEGVLALAASASPYLNDGQRWLVLSASILELFATTLVFYLLVAKHHWKLYAPFEYRSDEAFQSTFGPMTEAEKRAKAADEARADDDAVKTVASAMAGEEPLAARESDIEQEPKGFEQRVLHILSTEAKVGALVERLADKPTQRSVQFVSANGERVQADAIVYSPHAVRLVESRVIVSANTPFVSALGSGLGVLGRAATLAQGFHGRPAHGLLVLVAPGNPGLRSAELDRDLLIRHGASPNTRAMVLRLDDLDRLADTPKETARSDKVGKVLSRLLNEHL